MKADLVVIGNGYWGTAIAMFAERKGLKVIQAGETRPFIAKASASAVASGYTSLAWYKGAWRRRAIAAYDTAQLLGVKFNRCGANVVHRMAGKADRQDFDLMLFEPAQFLGLRQVDVRMAITVQDARSIGTRVVVAAGHETDLVLVEAGLPALGVTGLRGSALFYLLDVNDDRDCWGRPTLVKTSPYAHFSIRDWGRAQAGPVVRVCATQYERPEQRAQKEALMAACVKPWMDARNAYASPVFEHEGIRPILPEPTVKLVAPDVVAATGGGRVGGLLSFWAARETLRLFGVQ